MSAVSFVKLERQFNFLKNQKNLLAFSGGVDSCYLFHMLNFYGVDFDLACINYNTRPNSQKEAQFAKNEAKKHGKKAFIKSVHLEKSNFEAKARKLRYDFFEQIIKSHHYDNLLLAHQLDDRFEWLLMQFCKGAGAVEMAGFSPIEKREFYQIVRPLYATSKSEILSFLNQNKIKYFIDESNFSFEYKRNFFRQISQPLMQKYAQNIAKSFEYLHKDIAVLKGDFIYQKNDLFIFELQNELNTMRLIDRASKLLGSLLSASSRSLTKEQNAVFNRKIAMGKNERFCFVSPYFKIAMPKSFREECRLLKIPEHVRGFLYKTKFNLKEIENLENYNI